MPPKKQATATAACPSQGAEQPHERQQAEQAGPSLRGRQGRDAQLVEQVDRDSRGAALPALPWSLLPRNPHQVAARSGGPPPLGMTGDWV